jgi:transposase
VESRYVGIDMHRRRSVIYTMNAEGNKLDCVRIANDPLRLLETVSEAGSDAEVVIEATYGWYWAVDLLQEAGFRVHLAHPSGNDWGHRRVKNDERDARDLADLLRLGRLAEAWIAPPAVREARELVRYRAKLVQLRSGLKAQVHAVMAKEGVLPTMTDMFCQAGQRELDRMALGDVYVIRVKSLRDLIEVYDREIAMLERKIHQLLRNNPGYDAIQALNGVGRTIAAIFVAEIGDVHRFRSAAALCSWAGLAPWHRESDTKVTRLGITKMGSRRALGRPRSDRPLPRRQLAPAGLPSHRRTARQKQSPRRRGPQVAHARLLRPARRRDPLRARRPGGGVTRSDTTLRRARRSAWLPHQRRSRGM